MHGTRCASMPGKTKNIRHFLSFSVIFAEFLCHSLSFSPIFVIFRCFCESAIFSHFRFMRKSAWHPRSQDPPFPASQHPNHSMLSLDFNPTKARVENYYCEGGQIQIPPVLSLSIKRIPQIKCGLLQSEWR